MEKIILLVDNEDAIHHSRYAAFHDSEHVIISAANRESAFRAICENHINLCFLAIHLPDINGLEIMKMLRDVSPQTRIIMMTGIKITDAIMKEVRENAHCLISKPFELEQVKELAKHVLSVGKNPGRDRISSEGGMSSLQWLTDDNRKHRRKPITSSIICYAVTPHGNIAATPITANILNISETGVGIVTDCKLQRGYLIRLSDAPIQGRGVVRWSEDAGALAAYRAGIQFVAPENVPQ
jgi:DNA-binding NarL/FixJ family response regulator